MSFNANAIGYGKATTLGGSIVTASASYYGNSIHSIADAQQQAINMANNIAQSKAENYANIINQAVNISKQIITNDILNIIDNKYQLKEDKNIKNQIQETPENTSTQQISTEIFTQQNTSIQLPIINDNEYSTFTINEKYSYTKQKDEPYKFTDIYEYNFGAGYLVINNIGINGCLFAVQSTDGDHTLFTINTTGTHFITASLRITCLNISSDTDATFYLII